MHMSHSDLLSCAARQAESNLLLLEDFLAVVRSSDEKYSKTRIQELCQERYGAIPGKEHKGAFRSVYDRCEAVRKQIEVALGSAASEEEIRAALEIHLWDDCKCKGRRCVQLYETIKHERSLKQVSSCCSITVALAWHHLHCVRCYLGRHLHVTGLKHA